MLVVGAQSLRSQGVSRNVADLLDPDRDARVSKLVENGSLVEASATKPLVNRSKVAGQAYMLSDVASLMSNGTHFASRLGAHGTNPGLSGALSVVSAVGFVGGAVISLFQVHSLIPLGYVFTAIGLLPLSSFYWVIKREHYARKDHTVISGTNA